MVNKEIQSMNKDFTPINSLHQNAQDDKVGLVAHANYFTSKQFCNSFQNPIKPATTHDNAMQDKQDISPKHNVATLSTHQTMQSCEKMQNTNTTTFFSKTQTILDSLTNLSVFDNAMLEKGVKFNMAQSNDSVFFEFFIGSTLYLACAYSFIFEERLFHKEESPRLHFLKCDDLKLINPEFLKVCLPKTNSFDYRVRADGIDTRLFYEHPLRLCSTCISELCKLLSKKHNKEFFPSKIKESEIIALILKNKLKNLIF